MSQRGAGGLDTQGRGDGQADEGDLGAGKRHPPRTPRPPKFVEIDLIGHEGGNAVGEYAYTLTVTDIATGWTENRSIRNKARKWVNAEGAQ